jgi:hypothetical protein
MPFDSAANLNSQAIDRRRRQTTAGKSAASSVNPWLAHLQYHPEMPQEENRLDNGYGPTSHAYGLHTIQSREE